MPNLNQFNGAGYIGKDPRYKETSGGVSICNFTIGISTPKKINGEWGKHTEWVNCVVFGKQAEWLSQAQKGDFVIFTGRLETRSYETQEGVKRYITEVICSDAQAINKNKTEDKPKPRQKELDPIEELLADEIPF